jgi:hypothetical protein
MRLPRSKKIYVAVVVTLAAINLLAFQNCGQGLNAAAPGSSTGAAASSSGGTTASSSDMIQASSFSNCGANSVCFNSKMISFTNDNGAAATAQVLTLLNNGFVVKFTTPKGRTVTEQFTLSNGVLTAAPVTGSRAQFCLNHNLGVEDRCSIITIQGGQEYNCGSALHWSGSYAGDTLKDQAMCAPGSATPISIGGLPPGSTKTASSAATVSTTQAAALSASYSNVTLRLNDPTTSAAEVTVIQGLATAPTQAPPASYMASFSINPADLPQITNCSAKTDIAVPASQIPTWGPAVALVNLPMRSGSNLFSAPDPAQTCTPYGQWCSISFRGPAGGNTCGVFTNLMPKYSCSSSWVLSCKQFCESSMEYLNLPSGHGWVCNYGGYYGDTPNHDPNTYKETDRRGASWDL